MRALLTSVLLLATPAFAQAVYQWSPQGLGAKPSARRNHAMAFDAARGELLLFGGQALGVLGDTWTWNGTAWRRLSPRTVPPPRQGHAMAYDPRRQRVVMIGGQLSSALRDTWEWDGTNWTQVSASQPLIGGGGEACYHPGLGGVFYNDGTTNLLWDGQRWTNLSVTAADSGQRSGPMVYSAALNGVVSVDHSRVRVFRFPQGWQTVVTSQSLSLEDDYALALDPRRQHLVLQGGSSGNGAESSTWLWNGTDFARIADLPSSRPGRKLHAMVFDPLRDEFVTYGGASSTVNFIDETWFLRDVSSVADYQFFGSGCARTGGTAPALRADPLGAPAPLVGGSFTVQLSAAPAARPVSLVVGNSRDMWGPAALPLSLAPFGMGGCQLLVSPNLVQPIGVTDSRGDVWVTLAIPADQNLLGSRFYLQMLVLDPGANRLGIIWSDAGDGLIGNRL